MDARIPFNRSLCAYSEFDCRYGRVTPSCLDVGQQEREKYFQLLSFACLNVLCEKKREMRAAVP